MFNVSEWLGQSIFLGVMPTELAETATFTSQTEVSTIPTSLKLSVTSYATTKSFRSPGSGKKD